MMASLSSFKSLHKSSTFSFINTRKHSPKSLIQSNKVAASGSFPKSKGLRVSAVSSLRGDTFDRREVLFLTTGILIGTLWQGRESEVAVASEFADMPALRGKDYGKTKMRYADYTETESGLQYKDLRVGSGPSPKMGETVVIDWDGYTVGYLGRIFEARNKTKGGPFEGNDKEFYKFTLGSQQVIPAFEEAIAGMAVGGIRRIIVPPELGYPDNDFNKMGPRPLTFSVLATKCLT
ncbi:hypothetical protein AQUCO_04900005v1 [Aquilegia coerulea]|uniref:peptidylprolyl isomerase n=1 Tax=Aquilegia coerulea TaxID=218851 RepID=A0A2G5CJF0_AQUCA|nr:hypothetical protein AQUCO_04900005v1 [Aquilegia coerulea]